MKVAILGAGGALGARIIESFQLGNGPSVTAIAREAVHLAAAARFAIDLRIADVLDVDSLARSFAGCSGAVHALPIRIADAKRSAVVFCRAAAKAGVQRVLYVSTADVHGLSPARGTDESTALHVRHASAAVNELVAADRQFSAECRTLGLGGSVLRPGLAYGPRSEWVAQAIGDLERERVVLGDAGLGICNCIYIDDVVAVVRAALKPKSQTGATFLLTAAETVTWRDFYRGFASELQLPSPKSPSPTRPAAAVPAEILERQRCEWKFPPSQAAAALGVPASTSFAEGCRLSVAWWRFAQGEIAAA